MLEEEINQREKKILVTEHLIFAHDILRARGLGISVGTSVSFLFKHFTNGQASEKELLLRIT